MKLHETTDYDIFKKIPGNRDVIEQHVKFLMEEIGKKPLFHIDPIRVDKDMYLIDGQHRLEAARRLKVPVMYIVMEGARYELMKAFNLHRPWKIEDFIKTGAACGNTNLQRILSTAKEFKIPPAGLLRIVRHGDNSKRINKIRTGNFDLYLRDEEIEIIRKVTEVRQAFIDHCGWSWSSANRTTFLNILYQFLEREDVELDVLLKRMEMKGKNVIAPFSQKGFQRMLVEIYNYRATKKRIEIEPVSDL